MHTQIGHVPNCDSNQHGRRACFGQRLARARVCIPLLQHTDFGGAGASVVLELIVLGFVVGCRAYLALESAPSLSSTAAAGCWGGEGEMDPASSAGSLRSDPGTGRGPAPTRPLAWVESATISVLATSEVLGKAPPADPSGPPSRVRSSSMSLTLVGLANTILPCTFGALSGLDNGVLGFFSLKSFSMNPFISWVRLVCAFGSLWQTLHSRALYGSAATRIQRQHFQVIARSVTIATFPATKNPTINGSGTTGSPRTGHAGVSSTR
mmetsp:Transcript_60483/g.142719  ORF Transcript_60483/g.142719 Transcript_60483/m.142719 type:complete len:266 (-) Transcript_60483:2051-2848(-)